jgi:hypothetical protein
MGSAAEDVAADVGGQPGRSFSGQFATGLENVCVQRRNKDPDPVAAGVKSSHYRSAARLGRGNGHGFKRPDTDDRNAKRQCQTAGEGDADADAGKGARTNGHANTFNGRETDARGIEHGLQDRGELLGMAATNRGTFFRKNAIAVT